jgi:acyl dehydratase
MTAPGELVPPPPRVIGPLTLTDLVRYQGAGGDMNPSHHDDEFARRGGSPGVFAPGLLSAALLADWATTWLGPENVRTFGVRFRSQVWLGDELTCHGAVTGRREADGQQLIDLELECRRQDGSLATSGWATFVLP